MSRLWYRPFFSARQGYFEETFTLNGDVIGIVRGDQVALLGDTVNSGGFDTDTRSGHRLEQ